VAAQHAIDLDVVDVAIVRDDRDVDLREARGERFDFRPESTATGVDGELTFGRRSRVEFVDRLCVGDGRKGERRYKAEDESRLAIDDRLPRFRICSKKLPCHKVTGQIMPNGVGKFPLLPARKIRRCPCINSPASACSR
jgi:hypothetical protein